MKKSGFDCNNHPLTCPVCNFSTTDPRPQDLGTVKGNTERYLHTDFPLWKCPKCLSIISIQPVDFEDIYKDYPLNKRQLDVFAKGTLKNLTGRLLRSGVKKTDTILDVGCGNGIYVDYLKQQGFQSVVGYDPYVEAFAELPSDKAPFDVIVNNDTLEHCDDIYKLIELNLELLRSGGLLYIGTADSEPVNMENLEPHVMRLHQPYHRIIITESTLHNIVKRYDVTLVAHYRRSYHDTLRPFSNYRFLDELNKALGHNLDHAMNEQHTTRAFLRNPKLWFFALFGYWFPSAAEPAVIVRKN
ncbi:class I SAM-dependent methyltransferase [Methylomonas montana]|uniref:class I SAM-dependent methyltransferase n=1 Tax=Methylomonas montana TaxID=3058963 RepID=UPI00265AA59C|nr:class I SAM-dependent methyltransferase [Methylomonas montana]WKJ89570.1 class I SAM-dependent methyltransferase [Methylomonas montana]